MNVGTLIASQMHKNLCNPLSEVHSGC